jgi:hypothetical protein
MVILRKRILYFPRKIFKPRAIIATINIFTIIKDGVIIYRQSQDKNIRG